MSSARKLVLGCACTVHAVQDGLGTVVVVLLPILAQVFGLGYSEVGIIRAAKAAAMMVFEMPSGVLAERYGERALLTFGLLAAGAGFVALSFANGFELVLLTLFVVGFGAAFQHALSSSLVTRTFAVGGKRSALGVYNTFGDVGKLAFGGVFSVLIGMGIAWQGVTAGFGLLAMAVAAALFVVLLRLDAGSRPRKASVHVATDARTGWGIRNRTGFSALSAIVFLDIAVQSAFLTFVAFIMLEKDVPAGWASLAVVVTLAGGIFGKLGCGMLADRYGVVRSLVVVECLTAAGIVAVVVSPTLLAYCLLPLVGLVLQGSSSITYATVGDLVDGVRHSRGFAAIYSISAGAGIVGPAMFGFIGDGFGLAAAMYAMAAFVLVPVPLCIALRPALAGEPA